MYHHMLHIFLHCTDALLESSLRRASAHPGFTHVITAACESKCGQDATALPNLAEADIVLLDGTALAQLPAMRKAAKSGAQFILVDDGAREPTVELLSLLDHLWPVSDSASRYDFYVARLLDAVRQRREHELTTQHFETIINLTSDLVWVKDAKGSHVKVNKAFCRLVGKSRQLVEGRGHYFIWDLEPEEYAQGEFVCLETDQIAMNSGEPGEFDEVIKAPQGMRQFKTRKAPLFNADGSIMGTVGIAHDVTDLANMTAELDLVLQSIPYPVMILDSNKHIVNFNDRFKKLFGIDSTDYIAGESRDVLRQRAVERLGFSRNGRHVVMRSVVDGLEKHIDMYESEILDIFKNVIGMICIYRDVTRQLQIERRLKLRANTDDLTELFNRHYFFRSIPATLSAGAGLAYIDLDNFKHVNDKFGHHAGDKALILTAQILRKHLRDAVIARLGGDEFAAFFPESCSKALLRNCAEELLVAMDEAFDGHEAFAGLSASIGITLAEKPGLARDDLVRQGDVAMYEAKRLGKRRYCVYSASLE